MDVAVLIFNGGSTGWKIAVHDVAADAAPVVPALAEATLAWPSRADDEDAHLSISVPSAPGPVEKTLRAKRGFPGIAAACEGLRAAGVDLHGLRAIGHRIVHGGPRLRRSVVVDDAVEAELRALEPLAPTHNPMERAAIGAARALFPGVPQVASFDTAFHRTLPEAAYTYAGPYAWRERGIRRFGFHGLSVAYCVERAAQLLNLDLARGGIVVAHLGGGCSVTAVRDGASVDTSMGYTPVDGIMMATRSGAVDPSILTHLARDARTTAGRFAAETDRILDEESGLFGISGVSGDVREVERAAASGSARAELALAMFAHRAAAAIAGMATSLARVDALVFTGGIGEHAAAVRARICARLSPLGIAIGAAANDACAADGRIDAGGIPVLALRTHEEWYVARECARVLSRARRPEERGPETLRG